VDRRVDALACASIVFGLASIISICAILGSDARAVIPRRLAAAELLDPPAIVHPLPMGHLRLSDREALLRRGNLLAEEVHALHAMGRVRRQAGQEV
jgi:hypothetical protein